MRGSTASAFPYRLALKPSAPGAALKTEGQLVEHEQYGFVLRAAKEMLTDVVRPHYVYVFSIDSLGRSTLLFPPPVLGNAENRFPLAENLPYPTEITLSPNPLFEVSEPFGGDTYYLLATVELLPDPWVLESSGARPQWNPHGDRRATLRNQL